VWDPQICGALLRASELERFCARACGLDFAHVSAETFQAPYTGLGASSQDIRNTTHTSEQGMQAASFVKIVRDSRTLAEVDLSSNNLGDRGLVVLLSGLETNWSLSKLSVLGLANVSIQSASAAGALAQLLGMIPRLHSLDLSNNGLRASLAATVAEALVGCSHIEVLRLAHNGFGDAAAARALAPLLASPEVRLRELDLSFNRIGLRRHRADHEWSAEMRPLLGHLEHLADLMPLLQRFPRGLDPCTIAGLPVEARSVGGVALEEGALEVLRQQVDALHLALAHELRPDCHCGGVHVGPAFTGSAADLFAGVRPEAGEAEGAQALAHVRLEGNELSAEAAGVVLHWLARMERETHVAVQERVLRHQDGQPRTALKAALPARFPPSARTAEGLQVVEWVSSGAWLLVQGSLSAQTVESGAEKPGGSVCVSHNCDVVLSRATRSGELDFEQYRQKARSEAAPWRRWVPGEQAALEAAFRNRANSRSQLRHVQTHGTQSPLAAGLGSPTVVPGQAQGLQKDPVRIPGPQIVLNFNKSLVTLNGSLQRTRVMLNAEAQHQARQRGEAVENGDATQREDVATNRSAYNYGSGRDSLVVRYASSSRHPVQNHSPLLAAVMIARLRKRGTRGLKAQWDNEGDSDHLAAVTEKIECVQRARQSQGHESEVTLGEANGEVEEMRPHVHATLLRQISMLRENALEDILISGQVQGDMASAGDDSSADHFHVSLDSELSLGSAMQGRRSWKSKGSPMTPSLRSLDVSDSLETESEAEMRLITGGKRGSGSFAGSPIAQGPKRAESVRRLIDLKDAESEGVHGADAEGDVKARARRAMLGKGSTGKSLWGRTRGKVQLSGLESERAPPRADEEGGDDLYDGSHPTLPTFACPERIVIAPSHGGSDAFVALYPILRDGAYADAPPVFSAPGRAPTVQQQLAALAFSGDITRSARLAADGRDEDTFWDALQEIRENSRPGRADLAVRAQVSCPPVLIIGEPFAFTYEYLQDEAPHATVRRPGAHRADRIELQRLGDGDHGGGGVAGAEGRTAGAGCVVILSLRPPHAHAAEVQLRRVVWMPGIYQLKLIVGSSDTTAGESQCFEVRRAAAVLDCPPEVFVEDGRFPLSFVVDYSRLVHPAADWIGVFKADTAFLTKQSATLVLDVPEKNAGILQVDTEHLLGEMHLIYFSQVRGCPRALGRCDVRVSPRPFAQRTDSSGAGVAHGGAARASRRDRRMRFYLSASGQDLAAERAALYEVVLPRLRGVCDARRLSLSLVDLRFGVSPSAEALQAQLTAQGRSGAGATLVEACMEELNACLPNFICLLGQCYGAVPVELPNRAATLFPCLADRRHSNPAVDKGVRMSLTEMEITAAVLAEPAEQPLARFYLRDPSWAAGRPGMSDTEVWMKQAMKHLMARVKRAAEGATRLHGPSALTMHQYFRPEALADIVRADLQQILDCEYPPGDAVPSDYHLFWASQQAAAAVHLHELGALAPRERAPLDAQLASLDALLAAAPATGAKVVLTAPAGGGKTAALLRWAARMAACTAPGGLSTLPSAVLSDGPLDTPVCFRARGASVHAIHAPADARTPDSDGIEVEGGGAGDRAQQGETIVLYFMCGINQRLRTHDDVLSSVHRALEALINHEPTPKARRSETIARADDRGEISSRGLLDDNAAADILEALTLLAERDAAKGRASADIVLLLDGLSLLTSPPQTALLAPSHWLPDTRLPNVHWVVSTEDAKQSTALVQAGWNTLMLEQINAVQREGMIQAAVQALRPALYREEIDKLVDAPAACAPEFLASVMRGVLRDCTSAPESVARLRWCLKPSRSETFDADAFHAAMLQRWAAERPVTRPLLGLIALSESGLYEAELLALLAVPQELPMQEYSEALCTTKAAIVIFAGIVAVRNVRLLLVLQRALTADGALRRELLERLKAYFGALPTCNRKIAEYPHVLHKLQDWATLYAYITEIPVFRAMYADPLRKRAFLNYLVLLEKRPTEVQATLRENFELYFAIHRRWFSTSSSTAGRVAYYELNPAIYRSPKDLLYFEDVTFHISAYFEQNGERAPHPVSHAPRLADRVMWTAGEHGVAIQDLESALKVRGVMVASHCLPRARKERFRGLQPIPHWALTIVPRAQALYGVSDFLRIPAVHRQLCRFPARVARLIRRLARLYALHLQAIIHDWLAPSGDGNRPAHRVPAYLEGVNISWWTTREGPEGGARMLPLKLRVCHVLAQTLEHDPTTEPADVADVLDNSARFGHLALMIWNSGAQNFEEDTLHARFAGEALSDQQRVKMYGRSVRDPVTLTSLPGRINHPIGRPERWLGGEPVYLPQAAPGWHGGAAKVKKGTMGRASYRAAINTEKSYQSIVDPGAH